MTRDEIRTVLASCLDSESGNYEPPTQDQWQATKNRFSCEFPTEMQDFIDLMSEFSFPGDILNVGDGPNNGNDSIELTYDYEVSGNPNWDTEMIPFYSIGNGDYFCVSSVQGLESAVYYYYADRQQFEEYSKSFEQWLKELPAFLD